MDSRKKILIIAGMPCSGKSTLLRHCLVNGVSLFGELNDPVFKQTRIPPLETENEIKFEDRVNNCYWLHEGDLVYAKINRIELNSWVIHFDLYWFCISILMSELRIARQDLYNLQIIKEMIADESNLFEIFGVVKNLMPFDAEVTLAMLDTKYNLLCDRWVCRIDSSGRYNNKQEFLHRHIYDYSSEGEKICESFVKSARKAFGFANHIAV